MADKVVEKEKIVTIEQRFKEAKERQAGNPGVLKKVEKRFAQALLLKEKIESSLELHDLYVAIVKGEYI